jgi:hypothetical protein
MVSVRTAKSVRPLMPKERPPERFMAGSSCLCSCAPHRWGKKKPVVSKERENTRFFVLWFFFLWIIGFFREKKIEYFERDVERSGDGVCGVCGGGGVGREKRKKKLENTSTEA